MRWGESIFCYWEDKRNGGSDGYGNIDENGDDDGADGGADGDGDGDGAVHSTVDGDGSGSGRGRVSDVFGIKFIHTKRRFLWSSFKRYTSSGNCADNGDDGRARGCRGVNDA